MDGRDATLALTNPYGYAYRYEGTQHVLYIGKDEYGHIQEFYRDDDWHEHDLNDELGAPPCSSLPRGYDFNNGALHHQHIVYRGIDGRVHELARRDSSWAHYDLFDGTAAPEATGDPFGYAFDNQETLHVVYRSTDGGIHELWWAQTSGWNYGSLTLATGAPPADSDPYGFVDRQGIQHVLYRGTDEHVYELRWNGAWLPAQSPTKLAPAHLAASAVLGVAVGQTTYIYYVADNGHITELSSVDGLHWHPIDVSNETDAYLPDYGPSTRLAGFSDAVDGSRHLYYVSSAKLLMALEFTPERRHVQDGVHLGHVSESLGSPAATT